MYRRKMEVTKTILSDLEWMGENVMPEIEKEILETGGLSVYAELLGYFSRSDIVLTMKNNGNIVCVFGSENKYGEGMMWFFTSKEVTKCPVSFYKVCKEFIINSAKKYKKLFGFISSDFDTSINFFKHLGCEIVDDVKYKNISGYKLEYKEV